MTPLLTVYCSKMRCRMTEQACAAMAAKRVECKGCELKRTVIGHATDGSAGASGDGPGRSIGKAPRPSSKRYGHETEIRPTTCPTGQGSIRPMANRCGAGSVKAQTIGGEMSALKSGPDAHQIKPFWRPAGFTRLGETRKGWPLGKRRAA